MIQNTTFLRRAVGSLLVALVTLVGFQAHAQIFDYTVSTDVTYNESHGFDATTGALQTGTANGGTGANSIATINDRITAAMTPERFDATACYVISGTAEYAIEFTRQTFVTPGTDCRIDGKAPSLATRTFGQGVIAANEGELSVGIKEAITGRTQQHLDFERGEKQTLVITAYKAGKATGTLTVNIKIVNFDESPMNTISATNRAPVFHLTKGKSASVLISRYFSDPEGQQVYFNIESNSTDVLVCDATDGTGQTNFMAVGATPPAGAIATVPLSEVSITPTNTAFTCSPSNTASAAQVTANAFVNPGIPGTSGNRVVTTRKVGPVLHISADSVVTDTSGTLETPTNTDLVDRPKGTYTAVVFYRVWTGAGTATSPRRASMNWAHAVVHVKVGANNLPQFAGGATGYKAEIEEGYQKASDWMAAWVAGDLDQGTTSPDKDVLMYSLEGQRWVNLPGIGFKQVVGRAGGAVYVESRAASGTGDTAVAAGIRLVHAGVDFETATTYTVNLQVTDTWSDPVSVPVTVTVKDVNELGFRKDAANKDKMIDDQNIVNGLKRTFNLDEYFVDPDADDEITYSAHTNIYTDVAAVGADNVLTITGGHAEKNKPSTVTVTVVATDGELTRTMEFDVTSRDKNSAPKITLVESGTVAIGASVFEADSAGTVLATVDYTDDDAADEDAEPTAMLTGGSGLIHAVVNPYMKAGAICAKGSSGCAKQTNKVAIVVGKDDLNHEMASRHILKLTLQDSWEPDKMSKALEIQVSVNDSNDAPMVKKDMDGKAVEIANQSIVVNGSGSLYTGDYFEDEDGDRLLVDAVSSDEMKVTVSVSGLDGVKFMGVAVTEEDKPVTVTLTASDPKGASATLMFKVTVGANNPPVADADAFMMALPENNTINVGAVAKVDLDGLFSEPDTGDDIMSITGMTSDEDILLVIPTDDGDTLTLVGVASGMATLTITAMDGGGNSTDHMAEITVNEAPAEAKPIDPVEMDRTMPHVVDVSGVFTDGDDGADMLTITAEAIEGMDRVELEVMDGQLTITGILGVMPGMATIRLTATDPHGATATSTFEVNVINVGPTVAMNLEDQEMDRTMPLTLDLSGVFMDADGEMLTITAEVQKASVVELGTVDDEGMLTVTALAVGMTNIVLTAVDEDGASIMADFEITVINIAPVVAEAVPDQSTTRAEDLSIDVSGVFNDPDADNDMLTISVAVANEMYVSAMLDNNMLMISGLDVGTSAITLTATDADGGMVETMFDTTIDNVAPVVANSISPISLEVGGQAASQSIAGLFTDDDDMLTYTVTSSNTGIAGTSLTGMTAMVTPMSRGSATITVTATDPHGASASVMGSVTVGDGELKAVAAKSLAGFGRAMLASVSSSVGSRLMNDARSSDLTLDAWAPVENQGTMSALTADDRSEVAWNTVNTTNTATTAGASSAFNAGPLSGVDALRSTLGQSFALNLGSTDNRSNWSVWGDIDRQSYEGAGYDGTASSIYLGADVTVAECWMFGVAVSTNSGESDYTYGTATQTMDMSLTTVLPYVSYQPSHGSSIWGVAGFGSGELETTVVGAGNETSDLSTQLTLVGGSQDLTRLGRMSLALRGDAAVASIETEDGNGAADGLAADVNRIRIGLEGSFRSDTGNGGMVEPFGQVSLRSDGGDGDTGTGVEIAGGIRLTGGTFTLEAQGRTLAMHGADEYSESGFSLMAKLNPSASATGVSVSIAPRWGADALGNGMLWQDTLNLNSAQTYGALAGFGNAGASKSIDTQIGYGMLVANEQFLLTPFVDLGISDSDRRETLLGITLQQMVEGTTSLDVNLALGRVEERTGASSGKIGLNATLRF